MPLLSAFLVGALFAVGLGVSGMTQPTKVIGFLDFFGHWDATLMFVMGGAVVLYFFFFRFARGYAPVLTAYFNLPTQKQIDLRLVIGSGMFGVGWGLAGFCPGPALTSLGHGATKVFVFVASMVAGMYLFKAFDVLLHRYRNASPPLATKKEATQS